MGFLKLEDCFHKLFLKFSIIDLYLLDISIKQKFLRFIGFLFVDLMFVVGLFD